MANSLKIHPVSDKNIIAKRKGETKLGESISFWEDQAGVSTRDQLKALYGAGVRYVILGIDEDIGARANAGRGGCTETWTAFLSAFLNTQANQFINSNRICVFGEVDLSDIQKRDSRDYSSQDELRTLCAEIDQRVEPIITTLVAYGFEPIVIGGGHNNAFPILKGTSKGLSERFGTETKLNCLNIDAHADFRTLEGRHSGNPFSYAAKEGILEKYSVLGLQESYNSQAMLDELKKNGVQFSTYEEIKIRNSLTLEQAATSMIDSLLKNGNPNGLEIDLDSIANMPSSAESPFGFSIEEVAATVSRTATLLPISYLHLCEGAPKWSAQGERIVGRTLSLLALTYLRARDSLRDGV